MKWPISCISGIAVIALYCAFTFTSLALYPMPYSPVTNWLSDLGNSSFNPAGAVFYNVGCILTGIALFPFFAGLYKWYTRQRWRKICLILTQMVGFLAAFSLIMIGVFSEDIMEQHVFWSSEEVDEFPEQDEAHLITRGRFEPADKGDVLRIFPFFVVSSFFATLMRKFFNFCFHMETLVYSDLNAVS